MKHTRKLEELRQKAEGIIAEDPAILDSLTPIEREVIVKLTGLDTPAGGRTSRHSQSRT